MPGVRVAMGEADWDELTRATNPKNERLPRRDIAVKDGDTITLGSTTVKLHLLGGHTPARSAWTSRSTTPDDRTARSCSAGPHLVRAVRPPNSSSPA